ncbi:HtaA domain-containing protein [Streptomyces cinnamoneus]|uniref:Htaa domain-containing protein n=1 Tax=Streptomyces cinnamoneus TaxID=53446 RepID=A0A918U0L5_STRCJ|nr:HtaA domain-containing protein [Streptomyces cinnamoneus]GHC74652.1 hypothetical protein GCM10010507_62590 [Streptomyces cinnamoneus]
MTVTARRRPLALAAAVATAAAALGTTALTVPAAHAADGPPPQMQLKDGTLEWGLKKSFREYIETGFGGGAIEVADGAQRTGDGPFTFTGGTGTYDMATHAIATTFRGGVRFLGHDGELDLKFADLKLAGDAGGKTGRITADVTRDGRTEDDVPLASLDLGAAKRGGGRGGVITLGAIPAKLTAQGAKVFSYKGRSFYKEGAALDNASLTVTAVAQPPAGGGTKDAGTSTDVPATKDAGTSTDEDKKTGDGRNPGGDPRTGGAPGTTGEGKAPQSGVYDGRLDWGVKKSFRDYITDGFAKGRAELLGDAVKAGDSYRFTKGHGTYDASTNTLDAAFNGEVRFTGHDGELDLKLGNFTVKASATGATLSADVSAKDKGSTTTTKAVPLADLKPGADALKARNGVVSLSAVPATLTEQGAKVFSYKGRSFYKTGSGLDPVTLAVTVDKDAKLPDDQGSSSGTGSGTGTGSGSTGTGSGSTGTGSGSGSAGGGAKGGVTGSEASLAATGAGVPTGPLAGGAAALVVAGGAAVYATRRRSPLARG